MTNSYGFFSTNHVAFANSLPYQQLFWYINITPNEYMKTLSGIRNASCNVIY